MIGLKRLTGFLLALAVVAVVGCAGTATSRSTGTYIDDKTISTQVVAKLAADPATKATQIQVETYNGVVQLSGFVDTKESIPKAEEIARSVEGVKDVKNNLVLR
jgi:osmotically-inducible protein OsmY